jgi:2-polyprenyl-6-methoxyphenol hydroxylase-like FAD-dependent oxidoreductase
MAQEQTPILIVGAGGAGLALSLMLHQQGIATLLVERRADVSWYPRARNLNFRTLEVFRGQGLEPKVIAAGTHFSEVFRKDTLASSEREEFPAIEQALHIVDHPEALTPEPLFWYCPQSRLEPLLLAEARQRGVDVRYNTELASFTQDDQGVTATIKDGATGAESTIRTEYLAACDGAHSHVRTALGMPTDGLGALDEYYIFVYFRADWGELIRGYESDTIFIERPDIQGFFLVTDEARGMFMITYAPSKGQSAEDYTPERCKDLIFEGIGKPDIRIEIVDIAHWQPTQAVAVHFQQGRVFLVGDAAHTMPPKLGLGVNTAIQSAQNLAWKLAAVLKGQAAPALLATYEAERHPVAEFVTEQSLEGPAAALLPQASEKTMLPPEERAPMFYPIAGFRYRSHAVLSEDPAPALPGRIELLERPEFTGQPGTRVPHLWVERDGQRISTLDLLDGRFVLLAGPDGAPWCEAAPSAAGALGIELAAYHVGSDGDLRDLDDEWQAKMGVPAAGAVLVRPDGFVAWRTGSPASNPEQTLTQVLSSILCRAS